MPDLLHQALEALFQHPPVEARRIVLEDPFVANGVFVLDEVLDWTIFVDELSGSG